MPDLPTAHRRLLEQFRGAMNLVGPGPVQPHFADSEAALEGLEPTGHWADLGSGAGFPGLVFAARFPGVALDLVDSRQKRCVFLEHVLAAAGDRPEVAVRNVRIETLPDASYDGILARALAPPDKVLEHARRLLRPGGRVLLMLQGDAPLPHAPDFTVERTTTYAVGGRERRSVLLRR